MRCSDRMIVSPFSFPFPLLFLFLFLFPFPFPFVPPAVVNELPSNLNRPFRPNDSAHSRIAAVDT